MGMVELRKEEVPGMQDSIFQTLFHNSSDAMLLLEGDRFVDCNPAALNLMRCTKAELTQMRPDQISPAVQPDGGDSQKKAEEMIGLAIEKGNHVFEWLHRRPDGTEFYADVNLTPILFTERQVVLTVWRDITQRKLTEQALKTSEELYRTLFDTQQDGVFLIQGAAIVAANPTVGQMTGYTQEELLQTPFLQVVAPEDRAVITENYRKRMAGEAVQDEYVMRLLRKDGETRVPVMLRAHASTYQGQPVVMGTVRNISETLRIETELRESQQRLELIVSSSPVVMFVINTEGVFTLSEGRGLADLGLKPGQVVGMSVFDVYRDAPSVIEEVRLALKGENLRSITQLGPLWFETVYAPIYDEQGVLVGTIGISTNITERKKTETTLQEAEQHLQEMLLRRGYQVQVSTEIAQEIASAKALEDLFSRVVTLVKERFGYYHTQILRFDPAQNAVVLITGYGEIGQRMLASRHRMELGRGLIGVAASTGQTVLRSDTSLDPDWRSNPLLPDTRGELAVPIKYGDQVLGVLDVQSDQPDELTEDDRLLLEGLCGQIAIAIEGTILRQQMEDRLNELNALYRVTSQDGWKSFRESTTLPSGFIYDRVDTRPAEAVWVDEIEKAIHDNRLTPASSAGSAAVAPLSVRGEVIGALGIYEDPDRPLNEQEMQLIGEISDQVALALESARLFEQTRLALGETEEQAQRLSALNEMSESLNKAGDAHEAMAIACQKTLEILHGERTSVALLDPSGDTFEVYALMGMQSMIPQGKHLPVLGTAIGLTMRENRVLLLPTDGAMENYMDARMLAQQGIHATMSAPLMAGTQVIGTLNIASAKATAFDDRDRILITQLSAVLASTIENRRLFERIQGALIATEKQYNFTRRLAEARDLQEVLISAVEAFGVGDINRAILFTFDVDLQDELKGVLVKATWYSGEGSPPFAVGTYFPAEIARSTFTRMRMPLPVYFDETDDDARSKGIFSAAVLPLWVGTRQIGAISLQATEQHVFTEEEKRSVPSLVQQTAIAIQSRLLFEETQASEARFRSTSEQLTEALSIARMGYFDYDANRSLFTMTDQFYHTLGTSAAEQGGYEISLEDFSNRFLYPGGGDQLTEHLAAALQSPEAEVSIQIEHAFRRPDDTRGYLASRYRIMKDETGTLLRIFGASQDISERKEAEETLESQRRTLQAVLDNMPAGVFMVEAPSGKPILTNKRAEDFLGRGISPTAIGDDLNEIYQAYKFGTDELYPPAEMPVVAGLSGQAKTISDMEVHKPDGSRVLLEIAGTPVYDASGNLFASVVVFQDITEKQMAQQVLESQRRTLQAVLDNMPAGVFMVEAPSGKPILTNKRAEDFLGRGISPTAIGDDLNQIYQAYRYGTEELYPPAEMPVVAGLMGQSKTISDMEVRKPDGSRVLLEINGAPVFDDHGAIIASVVVFTDITDRRRLEDTILQERGQLADALDAARMGNWEFDLNTGEFIFNDRFYQFLGTTAEAEGGYLMPAPVFASKYVHPDSQAEVGANVQEAIATSDPNYSYEGLSKQVLANGEVRDVIVRFSIEKDEHGRTVRLFGANQDVTEQRRAEATIAKRAAELATVSQVSTTVATILSPDEMLQTVVDLTKTSFSLYHTHIYLLNDQGSQLVLAKGAGEVGRQMVAEGRTIAIDTEQSLVASAGRARRGVIVNDVRQNPDFLPHPLLPNTRSEMAVPLIVGDILLGVMDIQSEEVNRFSQEDVSIMTTLGAQVAVSLQNARSYARAQRQAEREALINAISERIQSTNSVEDALQVAVRELGRALGAQHTAIRLGLERKGGTQ